MPSSIAYLAPPVCPISDTDARTALAYIDAFVARAWRSYPRDVVPDPDIYRDAALDALTTCLADYDPAKGRFLTYAYVRIRGAILDAPGAYVRWRHGYKRGNYRRGYPASCIPDNPQAETRPDLAERLQQSPAWLQQYAAGILDDQTARTIAAHMGMSEGRLSQRLKAYREGHIRAQREAQ